MGGIVIEELAKAITLRHARQWGDGFFIDVERLADALEDLGLRLIDARRDQFGHIIEELHKMSQSVSAQIDAATAEILKDNASIKADIATVAGNVTALSATIADLQAQLTAGTTVTQAQADALTAAASDADTTAAALHAIAAPPPPAATV